MLSKTAEFNFPQTSPALQYLEESQGLPNLPPTRSVYIHGKDSVVGHVPVK